MHTYKLTKTLVNDKASVRRPTDHVNLAYEAKEAHYLNSQYSSFLDRDIKLLISELSI
jgi:hypothetical protein